MTPPTWHTWTGTGHRGMTCALLWYPTLHKHTHIIVTEHPVGVRHHLHVGRYVNFSRSGVLTETNACNKDDTTRSSPTRIMWTGEELCLDK